MPQPVKCLKPWEHLYVKSTGEVLLCCSMDTIIGNLNQQSIEEIWDSLEAQKYRQGIAQNLPYKVCAQCKCFSPATLESYLKYE